MVFRLSTTCGAARTRPNRPHAGPAWRGRWSRLVLASLLVGCSSPDGGARWSGRVDTLPSGTILVTNPATGIWDSASAWQVVEELRIGTAEGSGPDLFGQVAGLEVDALGRI